MLSASGRFRILFNGEVYNFRELAQQFGLHNPRSGTDTEVIVELVERLGIDEAVAHFNGMWAMVIQDLEANRYYVSRDRFGKKPLYMHRDGSGVYMASEMHSLMGLPGIDLTPDTVTASRFLAQSLQNVDDRSWLGSSRLFLPPLSARSTGPILRRESKIRHFLEAGIRDDAAGAKRQRLYRGTQVVGSRCHPTATARRRSSRGCPVGGH